MENLNNVPSTGTFGGSVSKINSNFDLVVNAINSLEYQTTRSKGILNYGQNPATVFPNAVAGDWCMILSEGNVFPATIKTFNGSTWSGSGTWNPDGVDLTGYVKTTDMTTAIANSLVQATARMGYGECTVSGTTLTVSIPNFILPTSGGTIHIKMSAVGTGASTLNINSTGAKTLWYNGAAVSSTNTWEAREIISVFYDGTKYMASNSQGGGGNAEKIKYNNSQSGLNAENVQDAVDEVIENFINDMYSYETIDWVSQTTTLYYYINGSTGIWAEYNNNAKYMCRILPITPNTKYRLTAQDDHPINFALLNNNSPASHVGEVATDWNNGKSKTISAGGSIVIDSGEYAFLYIRNNSNSSSTDIKYPKSIEKGEGVKDSLEELDAEMTETEERVSELEDRFYKNVDTIPEVNYAFSVDVFGTSTSNKHAAIPVNVGEEYIIEAPSSVSAFYCFATTNTATSGGAIPFAGGMTSAVSIAAGESVKVTIPEGCSYLLVYNASNTRPFLIKKELPEVKTIYPLFIFEYIGGLTGDFLGSQTSFENGKNIATPRFIKTSNAFKAKSNAVGVFQVYYYDSEFNFLKVIVTQYPTANVELELIPDVPHSYVKIVFQREDAFIKANISLTGIFEDNWDVFNVKPSNGYHRIGVMVDVSDARCSDATTSTVQDEIDLRPNYGVIALPTTYSNIGKPTRLIIYCHGAGTHFTFNNSTGFNTSEHVDPTYWLKEGYAVMDIDGNPVDTEAHAFRPQAMEAYIAGYKWAIEHYNLCRDGVLLGGRSMGAGNTMYLLRGTCPIPVIAACANLPTSVAMGTSPSDKLHIANIRGFIIPDGFTFSNGPMNDADTQVFYDNWFKGIRYTPSIAICVDTPTTEEWRKNFIKNCCHVGEPYESNRIAACKDLHMIVRAPFKMFGCFEDPNNGYQATAQLYMTMLGNAGQQAEYRLYHSDKATNYPSDSRSAHYYELADPTLRTTVTTVYGEEVTNVPKVYVEMLQFWRRYEQGI